MSVVGIEHSGPFTEEQYFALPEDGKRHELIDGVLMMSPAPSGRHQRISSRLWRLLDDAVPEDLEVQGPINVRFAAGRILIPDLSVLVEAGIDDVYTPVDLVLMMVEVLSPSSARIDRMLKPGLAAEAGNPFYVLVEPEGPTVIVHELVDGGYQVVTSATGDEPLSIDAPFAVRFRPADLLATHG